MIESNRVAKTILKHDGYFREKIMECHEKLKKLADFEDLHDGEYGQLLNIFCMNVFFAYFSKINLPHECGLEYIRLFASEMCYGWDAHCEKN